MPLLIANRSCPQSAAPPPEAARRSEVRADHEAHDERAAESGGLERLVVADERGTADQRRETREHRGEPAVEASNLEPRPVVEELDDLPAVLGVRARALARARVADVRPPAVAQQPNAVDRRKSA